MKKNKIMSFFLLLLIIVGVSVIYTKRNFFQMMRTKKDFVDGYYIYISNYPSFYNFSFSSYKYEFQLPGICSTGYMKEKDSLIYEIHNNTKIELFNFRGKHYKENNIGEMIPSFNFYKQNSNGTFYFKLIPSRLTYNNKADSIIYKISFKDGIQGFLIKYNNTEKKYGEYP